MLNFVLCDDNATVLKKLEHTLDNIFTKHNFEAEVVFSSPNSDEILNYIKSNSVDVVFLDIDLKAKKTGLNLAEEIRTINKNCYIIFTTGHLEYVMVAYKYKTFDYLPKPITYERLESTIIRLFEDINGSPKRYLKLDNKNTFIDESEVDFIKRDGMKLVFHTISRDYEIYSSFNKFKDSLPENYIRCHKSYIANINKIKEIDPVSCTITFKDNSICYIGPKYKNDFMEVIKTYGYIK